MRIEVIGDEAIAHGPFPFSFLKVVPDLSGKKVWKGSSRFEFDPLAINIKFLQLNFPDLVIEDKTGTIASAIKFNSLPIQQDEVRDVPTEYKQNRPLIKHMAHAVNLGAMREAYAYLMEVGLFKTGITIANAGILYLARKITGVVILAPNGVYEQWAGEIAIDLDVKIKRTVHIWRGKRLKFSKKDKGQLEWLLIGIDAVRTDKGYETIRDFLVHHSGDAMMVIDESHRIKSNSSDRTKAIMGVKGTKRTPEKVGLRTLAKYRRILTGTLMTKNILDAWTQFNFLDERILNQKYEVGFINRYCKKGNFQNRQIVGQKNVEEFYSLIAPHSYRMTRAEAGYDIPNQMRREYVMGEKVRSHYMELRETYLTQLDSGEIIDAKNGAVAVMRLSQLICGCLPHEDKTFEVISDERIVHTMELIEEMSGPIIIWSRFVNDIKRLVSHLCDYYGDGAAVGYDGSVSTTGRKNVISDWLAGHHQFLIANQATGGTGLNLQGKCLNAIYFSQSYNATERIQSEGRIDREGKEGPVAFFDLICKGSVDVAISRNLREKRENSKLTLDDIRIAIQGKPAH